MNRLIASMFLALGCANTGEAASVPASVADERSLRFFHIHTRQQLEVTYYRDGEYDPMALKILREFLADWRDKDQKDIDPRLLDIVWRISLAAGHPSAFEIISAYRSPATNEHLRARTIGVAEDSMHIEGRAIDLRLPGFDTKRLRDTAEALGLGGVGYYPDSDFIHVDTGAVRQWSLPAMEIPEGR